MIITRHHLLFSFIFYLLIIWGIWESICGYLQLYDITTSNHSLYKLTGSFQNPGPYAGFLVSILPFALWQALRFRTPNKYLQQAVLSFSCIYVFFSLSLLPATMSRAAWLAAGIGIGIILIYHYRLFLHLRQFYQAHRKQAIIYICISGLFITIAGAGIYHVKKDSADGRLLMWKVTTRIIAEHPLTGVGWGNFAGAYGQAQADYFAEGKATPQEEWVAGSPEYAFNEFLQITAEHGIIGLILFLLVIVLAFRSAYKNGQIGIVGSLAAFLTFACFSYPFRVWQMNILFIILLVTAFTKFRYEKAIEMKEDKKRRKWKIYTVVIILALLIPPLLWTGKRWQEKQQAIAQWQDEQSYYNMEIFKGTVDNYRKLYWQLRDEPKFLFELGQCLSKTEFYEESNRILLEGARQSSDPMFWNIMGKNYQAMSRFNEAEECFTHAYHMIPHRLYPLYLLANLYFQSGQTAKGIEMAQRVIDKNPKVMSSAIQEMKTEMRERLAKYD